MSGQHLDMGSHEHGQMVAGYGMDVDWLATYRLPTFRHARFVFKVALFGLEEQQLPFVHPLGHIIR